MIGPLVSAEHHDKVMRYMELARASGARHIVGGTVRRPGAGRRQLRPPAVFADCTDDMAFVTDEVFGPLMAVLPFDDEDEVVRRANATPYGLAAAVFTTDFARANRVANALEAGSVWINDYGTLPASVPFGGYKHSGIGRENGDERDRALHAGEDDLQLAGPGRAVHVNSTRAGTSVGDEFADPGEQDIERRPVQAALGDDHVGVTLARLDEALVRRLDRREVLLDHRVGGAPAFGNVALKRRISRMSAAVSTKILRSKRSRRARS